MSRHANKQNDNSSHAQGVEMISKLEIDQFGKGALLIDKLKIGRKMFKLTGLSKTF